MMDEYIIISVVAVWLTLNFYVLPKLGINT